MNIPIVGQNFSISGYTTVKCTGNPEQDAKNFAEANGITVEQAKNILQGQFGAPQQVQNTTSNDVVTAIMQPDKEEDIVIVDETTDLLSNNNDKLIELKSKTADLEAALKAQDKAYVAWMNDYSNSTKQQTYWDSVTYSGLVTDALIELTNKYPDLLNDSVKDALIHMREAVKMEDETYVTWQNGGSWQDFATAMTKRYEMNTNFVRAVNKTQAFTPEEEKEVLSEAQKNDFKAQLTNLEAAIEAQDVAYVDWMNDYSNSTKQQTYWDSVTYSGVITDKLLLLMNSIDSVLINDSVLDALNHLKQAVSVEDSTYVTWTSGGSWDNFATAMTTRYVNTQNFIQAVRHTHFADI